MFVLIVCGVDDCGESFLSIESKVLTSHEEGVEVFRKYIEENYEISEDCEDEEGTFVDFRGCLFTQESDSSVHIELKSLRS